MKLIHFSKNNIDIFQIVRYILKNRKVVHLKDKYEYWISWNILIKRTIILFYFFFFRLLLDFNFNHRSTSEYIESRMFYTDAYIYTFF